MKEERKTVIKAVLFDFDGTLSTLRSGWEQVMRPLMLEMIHPTHPEDPALRALVDAYIDQSTGIQTIYQMQWLREEILRQGHNPEVHDAWWYKDLYNTRLMEAVSRRVESVRMGVEAPERYLVAGSRAFLQALTARGIALFVASGTDDADVKHEAEVLGLSPFFVQVRGAPHRRADCSKEAVLRALIAEQGYQGGELAVIGDGKVEIALGVEAGARTLGIASDEEKRCGINPVKERRLRQAGAERIAGDFLDLDNLLAWLS